ncbi:hypothetical protein AURDEDRAFT_115779 [Auricularia subglabra TFB-10046 SS5]|nr:hypothetical protein AURDEDRAFT_115779 [Auricularia subglabra TFB-10046 SS5]
MKPNFVFTGSLIVLLSGNAIAQAITIPASDPHLKYTGNWTTPSICAYNAGGDLNGDQPGCYNLGPSPCADEFKFATSAGASVSFSFKGTAIALSTLTQPGGTLPGLVTVSLDGDDETFKTVPVARPLSCPSDPFQKGELDAEAEHTFRLVLRLPPASDLPVDQTLFFGVKEFVITGGDILGGDSDTSSTSTPSEPTKTTGVPPVSSHSTSVAEAGTTTGSPNSPSSPAAPPNAGLRAISPSLTTLVCMAVFMILRLA